MIEIMEKILRNLSFFVLMAMLSANRNGTDIQSYHGNNPTSVYFHEGFEYMMDYLSRVGKTEKERNHIKDVLKKLIIESDLSTKFGDVMESVKEELNYVLVKSGVNDIYNNTREENTVPLKDSIDNATMKIAESIYQNTKEIYEDIKVMDSTELTTDDIMNVTEFEENRSTPAENDKTEMYKWDEENVEHNEEVNDINYSNYLDGNFIEENQNTEDYDDIFFENIEDRNSFNFMLPQTKIKNAGEQVFLFDDEESNNYTYPDQVETENVDLNSEIGNSLFGETNFDSEDNTTSNNIEMLKSSDDRFTFTAESDEVAKESIQEYESNAYVDLNSENVNSLYGETNFDSEDNTTSNNIEMLKRSDDSFTFTAESDEVAKESIQEYESNAYEISLGEHENPKQNEDNAHDMEKYSNEPYQNNSTLLLERSFSEFTEEGTSIASGNNSESTTKVSIKETSTTSPVELRRRKRRYNGNLQVKLQHLQRCQVPPSMETAQGYCKATPSGITCNVYCIKGYTFPEGISRQIKCTESDGWNMRFEECKPYADCTLRLRSSGTLRCSLTTSTKNAMCYVSCNRHGLNPFQKRALYECNSLGLWTPVLPHCVVREGIDLVDPPVVKVHESIDYP